MHQRILVLDYGSRLTQLIARRVRDAGVYCEIHPGQTAADTVRSLGSQGLQGIILSGCEAFDDSDDAPKLDASVLEAGVPVLGIGYGMQAMAAQLGGALGPRTVYPPATAEIRARGHTRLLDGIQDRANASGHGLLTAWMNEHDRPVTQLPPGFVVMASTASGGIAGMADESRGFYGVQFHPEVTHTLQGAAIISRFVREICACRGDWNMPDYIAEAVQSIREQVGDDEVLLGLSGGVDSSVAAALIHKAIGSQLTCVFVDHGLLRLNEAQQVKTALADHFGMNVVHVNAADRFMGALAGTSDPEAKRKIIGREFVEVFQEEAGRLQNVKWLAQGTIYPDVIESATKGGKNVAVKSHHNVGGLPDTLNLKLLEPLRELFKDEVRQLGVSLGLPPAMVHRHPFPGPGLGVRILGEIKPDHADTLRQADAIFIQELQETQDSASGKSWYDLTSQAFAVFLPVKSVGVTAAGRAYDHVIALRAVQTTDFMTAHWAELPHALLGRVANRIINEVTGVSRVVYDVSGKPPATIEWE